MMRAKRIVLPVAIAACAWCLALAAEPPAGPTEEPPRVSVAVARDRAELMHGVYAATLEVMHERYFHGERATVPARALEDVFAEIKRQSQAEARWISVNTRPMSINHEPKTEFEKQAARELASGKSSLEAVEDGYYRRAGRISLHGGCISCHAGFFAEASASAKFAGLIISVPVTAESNGEAR
jgi:hypothetical protein